MIIVWLKFLLCVLAILFAGKRLVKYGDIWGGKLGLSHAWVGIVLLAIITSLPELANGISAVVLVKMPNLAAGDIFGACMINMFTLACLDLYYRFYKKESLFANASSSNLFSTLFGAVILVFSALAIWLGKNSFDFSFLNVSLYSIFFFVVYLIAQKIIFNSSKQEESDSGEETNNSLPSIIINFLALSLIVILAGCWLPFIGSEIVTVMGWGSTFVAVLFLGIATTLPELTVSFSALKLGFRDMAVGNLVGSNLFNVSILFIVDVFYRSGSIFTVISSNMILAAMSGAVLMGLAYLALKIKKISYACSFLIILLYLLSLFSLLS